ncbi:MAG: insulinase family protein [Bacteroidales bacterium]|nr:insulinase family protein [Bacteroidales bacterium]
MKTILKKISFVALSLFLAFSNNVFAQVTYKYETVPNDPLKARIYTLDNGLKVYLTENKNAPRIQMAVAVRTGGKNDPQENTGLSHYLEHLMFKGTKHYGTTNFPKEDSLLQQIENEFEIYRSATDTIKRKQIYHIIDSISTLASKFAIPSEYAKMIGNIGGRGLNAWTSEESTVYIEDIPSNQLDKWMVMARERFSNPVLRLFHTELETVYEEKNMYADMDDSKVNDALLENLFQKHPYRIPIIGTTEHLKNPSIKAIYNYFNERYVPNNMAIIMSGDFNSDSVIAKIDKYFSDFPRKETKPFVSPVEEPIAAPIVKEVLGPDAEQLMIGFRLGGINTKDADLLTLTSMILSNNTAGLIDLNLNQAQKVLSAYAYNNNLTDYSMLILGGKPKSGQKLEEVKDLLLSQLELLKKGDFPDWLLSAIINDFKKSKINESENNMWRAYTMIDAFIKNMKWEDAVNMIDRLSKITKQDIIDFANKNFNNNYVVVYKKTGVDKNVEKITKPQITTLNINRQDESSFLKEIMSMETKKVEPVFINFETDLKKIKTKNAELIYKENTENKRFSLYYRFEMGTNNNKKLGIALNYLKYLGTSKYTPAEVKQEFYKNGCSFDVFSEEEDVWVMLSGISEKMEKGMELFEHLLANAKPNQEVLGNLVKDVLKKRADDKLSKDAILWSGLFYYGIHGKNSPFTNILSETELNNLKAEELVSIIKGLTSYEHKILYYGPEKTDVLPDLISKYHKTPKKLLPVPAETKFEQLDNNETKCYIVDYDMKQVEIVMLSKSGKYNNEEIPLIRVFSEYFGNGLNSIVFQEIREARALAYSAYAGYQQTNRLDRNNFLFSFIGTQVDKMPEAMSAMFGLFNDMPESEKYFKSAKEAIENRMRTERIVRESVIFNYLYLQKLNINYDRRKDVFAKLPFITMKDLKGFQESKLKDKKFNIMLIGKKAEIDAKTLEKYGKVQYLTLEEIFGY